jgi:hypothetical protein
MSNENQQTDMSPVEKAGENEDKQTRMDSVEKPAAKKQTFSSTNVFVRPVFDPVNINEIDTRDAVRTEDVHVLDRGAESGGAAFPFNIMTWSKGITEQVAQLTARVVVSERNHEIAIKCPICSDRDKDRTLLCGHRFCVTCIRRVEATTTDAAAGEAAAYLCPICRGHFVAGEDQPSF